MKKKKKALNIASPVKKKKGKNLDWHKTLFSLLLSIVFNSFKSNELYVAKNRSGGSG